MINFIYGAIFVVLGVQLLQNISDCFQSLLQWFCAWCNIHTVNYNTEINKLAQNNQQQEETKTNVVGFNVHNEEEECEDDE